MPSAETAQSQFIVVSHYRSGSTLLAQLLNQHPAIGCDMELLQFFIANRVQQSFMPFVLKAWRLKSGKPVYGWLLKSDQLLSVTTDPVACLQQLHEQGWQFIHLERLNLLRAALSNMLAQARNHFHERASGNTATAYCCRIDPAELLNLMRWNESVIATEKALLQDIPHLQMVYEHDLLRPEVHQATAERIFAYLHLPNAPVKMPLRRLGRDRLADNIENYAEICRVLHQTPYARFLD